MKNKILVSLLTISLVFTSASFIFANDEVEEIEESVITEQIEEPQIEEVVEEKSQIEEAEETTEEIKEKIEESVIEETQTEKPQIENKIEEQKIEEPIEQSQEIKTETIQKLPKTKTVMKSTAVQAPKLTLQFHFQVMNEDGNFVDAKVLTRTVNEGGSTSSISASIANNSVKNKVVTVGEDTYTFDNKWENESHNTISFPIVMTYAQVAEILGNNTSGDIILKAIYKKKRPDIQVTVKVEDIRQPDGTIETGSNSNIYSDGVGGRITKQQLESLSGLRTNNPSFTFMGYKYTYTGKWIGDAEIDSNTTIYVSNTDGENTETTYHPDTDITFTFKPVWEKEKVQGLDYHYEDYISTGSGSWSNGNAFEYYSEFGSYTHTFSDPSVKTPVDNYIFVDWRDEENNKSYNAGDSFTYTVVSNQGSKEYWVYAYWQPIVTVNYYDEDGTLIKSQTGETVNIYEDCDAPKKETEFLGWYENDKKISQDAIKHLDITKVEVETEFNVYAKYKPLPEPTPQPEPTPEPEPEPTPTPEPTPEPTPTPIPTPTPQPEPTVVPSQPTQRVTAVVSEPAVESEPTVESAPAPKTTIPDSSTPKAKPIGSWALINLIATILSCLIAIFLIFVKKEKEDDEEEYTDEEKDDIRIMRLFKIMSLIFGVLSIIIFIFTENMSLPMVLVDKWTLLMILLLIIEIVNIFIIRRKSKGEESND